MKRLEIFVENVILASRWLLVVFYIGLGLALALYAITFGAKLWDFASHMMGMDETETILKILGLIDAALIASLVVMVIISGRSAEHTSELQSLMRNPYAVFCLHKKKTKIH